MIPKLNHLKSKFIMSGKKAGWSLVSLVLTWALLKAQVPVLLPITVFLKMVRKIRLLFGAMVGVSVQTGGEAIIMRPKALRRSILIGWGVRLKQISIPKTNGELIGELSIHPKVHAFTQKRCARVGSAPCKLTNTRSIPSQVHETPIGFSSRWPPVGPSLFLRNKPRLIQSDLGSLD